MLCCFTSRNPNAKGIPMVNVDLAQGELLLRVHRYEIERGGELICIDLSVPVSGQVETSVVAVPVRPGCNARMHFCGTGPDEESALSDCLRKIKGIPGEQIFEKHEGQRGTL